MARRQLPLMEMERDELLRSVRLRRNNWVTYAPYLDMIHETLQGAELLPADAWDGVVGVGSVVEVRQLGGKGRGRGTGGAGRVASWELVGPGEEDEDAGRLSVISPLGWELLGAREGDTVYAATMAGVEGYVVDRVTRAPADGRAYEPAVAERSWR